VGKAAMPTAVGRVLNVVRKLIDYAKHLADTLRQRAAAPNFVRFAKPFGTADLAVILARITNGLRRAAALEERLCCRAARGRDLTPASIPLPALRGSRALRQAPSSDAQPEPHRADPAEDPSLARLPTEEEIAAEVRRRPIGAVIADICLDLAIAPADLDRAFWNEIRHAITHYGGSLLSFMQSLSIRWLTVAFGLDPASPAARPRSPAPATGPP
jgi:hypothetical protein